jgi:hypothetical protein
MLLPELPTFDEWAALLSAVAALIRAIRRH